MSKQVLNKNDSHGTTVLLTGGTGFLGKVILEQLLRQRVAWDIRRIIVVIRPQKDRSADQRFVQEVKQSPCFSRLSLGWEKLIEVLSADLSLPHWGLSIPALAAVADRVTHVIHAAASVEFNLRLSDAAKANIAASLEAVSFARRCPRLASLVCVSTAYVHPHSKNPLGEQLVPLPFDPATLYARIQTGEINEHEFLRETGHPNTYTLTKCVAEHLIVRKARDLPLTIIRPSIIAAAWRHPFPGWIDSHAALGGFVAAYGAGLLRVVAADPEARLDVVPVDFVAKAILDASFARASGKEAPAFVQVIAGLDRSLKIADIRRSFTTYFGAYPAARPRYFKYVQPLTSPLKLAHLAYNLGPLFLGQTLARIQGKNTLARRMAKLRKMIHITFEDFNYFTHNSFDFRTSAQMLSDVDSNTFLHIMCQGVHQYLLKEAPDHQIAFSSQMVRKGDRQRRDFEASPKYLLNKAKTQAIKPLLMHIFDELSVDVASFQKALASSPKDARLIIAPTYRSYADILVSLYVCAAYPQLSMSQSQCLLPPDWGPLAKIRSRRKILESKKPLILFAEEKRSGSRKFQYPNVSVFKNLQKHHSIIAILPVAIAYDRLFEETHFLDQLKGYSKGHPDLWALLQDVRRLVKKHQKLGLIHVSCAPPILLRAQDKAEDTSPILLARWQEAMAVSDYHLVCYADAHPGLGLTSDIIAHHLKRQGVQVLSSPLKQRVGPLLDPVLAKTFRAQWDHHLGDFSGTDF